MLTSIGAPIGTDVAELDDMFLMEPLSKGIEALTLDAADGQHESSYPRWRDGQQGIQTHPDISSRAGLYSTALGMPAAVVVEGREKRSRQPWSVIALAVLTVSHGVGKPIRRGESVLTGKHTVAVDSAARYVVALGRRRAIVSFDVECGGILQVSWSFNTVGTPSSVQAPLSLPSCQVHFHVAACG